MLQNREVTPLGSNQAVPVNIRLICATNSDPSILADEEHFRKDLIYRINTVDVMVPALRYRGTDVLLLAKHFITVYQEEYYKSSFALGADFISKLKKHTFFGNVRELQYVLERVVIMADDDTLRADDLVFSSIESTVAPVVKDMNLDTVEKNTILTVLGKNRGNVSKSAKELGITRAALYRRLDKYEL